MIKDIKKYDKAEIFDFLILSAIFLFASTRFMGLDFLHTFSKGILGIGGIYLIIKNPSDIRKDPVFILFYTILLTQIITWVSVKIQYPEFAYKVPKIDRLGKLFLFIPIAWWLKGKDKNILIALILAAVSFFVSLFFNGSLSSEISNALNGARVDFGVRNAQHTSMFFGVIFLFSFLYLLYNKKKSLNLVFIIGLIIVSIGGMVATQTRQSFLSLVVSLMVLFFYTVFSSIRNRKVNLKEIVLIVLTLITVFSASYYSLSINDRTNKAIETAGSLLQSFDSLNFENKEDFLKYYIDKQKNTGSGIRVQLWLATIPRITEKPILGWGSNGERLTIRNSKLLPENIRDFGHLHNFFLGTLLSYGLAGLIPILSLYIWLMIAMGRVKERIINGRVWFLLTLIFVTYWIVINNFEAFNTFWTGVFVHNIVLGCLYTKYLYSKDLL